MKTYLTGIPDRAECFRVKQFLEDQGHDVLTPFDLQGVGDSPARWHLARTQAVHDVASEGGRLVLPHDWTHTLTGAEWDHVNAERAWAMKCKMAVAHLDTLLIPADA